MSDFAKPFRRPDFRRLFAGTTTSQLGDQFALVATPWLVMHLTGDPLALGLVLALEGAPRALFMLVGGAVSDRLSPRLVLLVADLIRMGLAALLAAVVLTGAVEMWMVYGFALGFGLVAGFAIPAGNAMVPGLVSETELEAGNASVMGGGQIMGFAGPFAAGVLVGHYSEALAGVGLAFAVDAATFAVSAWMLWRIRSRAAALQPAPGGIGAEVAAGLRLVWSSPEMRLTFLIIAAVNFLFVGPIMVGIPVLADTRLPEGAVAFGLLMSGFAGGNLAGYVAAGALPRPGPGALRRILVTLLAGFALVLAVMGATAATWVDVALLAALGIGNGYVTIVLVSALQARTPRDMLGRVMGLMMFSSFGLVPVSEALSGALGRWDVSVLFLTAAALTALVALWAATQPALAGLAVARAQTEA